jgi:hypothetical protein
MTHGSICIQEGQPTEGDLCGRLQASAGKPAISALSAATAKSGNGGEHHAHSAALI